MNELWYERQVAYFEDLSAYSYSDVDVIEMDWGWLRFQPGYDRINVGWLDASHAFEEGPTPNWFADALLDIIAAPPINMMRGLRSTEPQARAASRSSHKIRTSVQTQGIGTAVVSHALLTIEPA
ncbi:hypothetical protein [Micromonospora sp. NPDC047730]|uniref:DUF7919 family protein n=1 Tax=Micromonospora sp. NPDC047730 TaxID=3364253 RepID=UPI003720C602